MGGNLCSISSTKGILYSSGPRETVILVSSRKNVSLWWHVLLLDCKCAVYMGEGHRCCCICVWCVVLVCLWCERNSDVSRRQCSRYIYPNVWVWRDQLQCQVQHHHTNTTQTRHWRQLNNRAERFPKSIDFWNCVRMFFSISYNRMSFNLKNNC